MVYDNTVGPPDYSSGKPGFAIHKTEPADSSEIVQFELYTDDGKGNGDFICSSPTLYWIRGIADALYRYYQLQGFL